MIKYFCDKCGKELENYDVFTVTITPPEIRTWADDARTGDGILCRDCIRDFHGWLGKGEKDERDNSKDGQTYKDYWGGVRSRSNKV